MPTIDHILLGCLTAVVVMPVLVLGGGLLIRKVPGWQHRRFICYDFLAAVEAFLLFSIAVILDVYPVVSTSFSVLAILCCVIAALGIIIGWGRLRTRLL